MAPHLDRLHRVLVRLTLATAVLLAVLGAVLATVGVPAYVASEFPDGPRLGGTPLPVGVLLGLFAAGQAWSLHRGRFGLAWASTLGVVAFAVGFYPSAGHLLSPLVWANLLLLAGTHGLDRWLVRDPEA